MKYIIIEIKNLLDILEDSIGKVENKVIVNIRIEVYRLKILKNIEKSMRDM